MEQKGPTLESASFQHSTGKFTSNGDELFYQCWIPKENKAICTVILSHGLGDHSGHYMTIVNRFPNCNFYGFDLIGHGNSPGKRGHVNHWTDLRGHFGNFVSFVSEKEPALPLVLFGNSLGGLLTIDYLQQSQDSRVTALMVNSPALGFSDVGSVSAFFIRMLCRVTPGMQMNLGLDSTKLTSDPVLANENTTDPLIHSFATPKLFVEFLNAAQNVLAHPELMKTPILLIQGDKDPIITPSVTEGWMKKVAQTNTLAQFYSAKNCRHESFNEVTRDVIFKVIEEFLNARLSPKL